SSRVSESGHISIPTDTLDHLIDTPPTFIKMDIEGSESDAIDGARETIARYHPILAISIYHKSSDFWKIPQQVLQIYNGYALYVRHYTESIYETVMFFIPPERIRELL
ncbi:MAG: FkbM family methyltransferase, partial [Epsilonproteobacteria bacterium]|nr:FkbM family methyltransferase [Campylobacterota bacterium]